MWKNNKWPNILEKSVFLQKNYVFKELWENTKIKTGWRKFRINMKEIMKFLWKYNKFVKKNWKKRWIYRWNVKNDRWSETLESIFVI